MTKALQNKREKAIGKATQQLITPTMTPKQEGSGAAIKESLEKSTSVESRYEKALENMRKSFEKIYSGNNSSGIDIFKTFSKWGGEDIGALFKAFNHLIGISNKQEEQDEISLITNSGLKFSEEFRSNNKKEKRKKEIRTREYEAKKKAEQDEISLITNAGLEFSEEFRSNNEKEKRKKEIRTREYEAKKKAEEEEFEQPAGSDTEDEIISEEFGYGDDFNMADEEFDEDEAWTKTAEEEEAPERELFLSRCEKLKEIIEKLRKISSNISKTGYDELKDEEAGAMSIALNTFINKLTLFFNFITAKSGNRPIMVETIMETTADSEDEKDDEDDRFSNEKRLSFVKLNEVTLNEMDYIKDFYRYSNDELDQLDEFFKENGVLDESYNNLVKEIKKREEIEQNAKSIQGKNMVESDESKYNQHLISTLRNSLQNNRKAYNPAELCNPETMNNLENDLKSMKKIVSKRSSSSIFKKNSLNEDEQNYMIQLDNNLSYALDRLKRRKSGYENKYLKNLEETINNQYKNAGEFSEILDERAYRLKSAREYIMMLEDNVTPFLRNLISEMSGDNVPLLFKIVGSGSEQEAAKGIVGNFLNIIHTPDDEKKYNFLNYEHINRVIKFIEAEEAMKEEREYLAHIGRLELDKMLLAQKRKEGIMNDPRLQEIYAQLEATRSLGNPEEISNSLGKLMPALENSNEISDTPIDSEKGIEEKRTNNNGKKFDKHLFEYARMVARVCGAISAGQGESKKFKDYQYTETSKLYKLTKQLKLIAHKKESISGLPSTLSQFMDLLDDFQDILSDGIPSLPSGNLKTAGAFADELEQYIKGNGYKKPKNLMEYMKKLVTTSEKKAFDIYISEDENKYFRYKAQIELPLEFDKNKSGGKKQKKS